MGSGQQAVDGEKKYSRFGAKRLYEIDDYSVSRKHGKLVNGRYFSAFKSESVKSGSTNFNLFVRCVFG